MALSKETFVVEVLIEDIGSNALNLFAQEYPRRPFSQLVTILSSSDFSS